MSNKHPDLIVSDAHEVVLRTGSKKTYVCIRCGYTDSLKMLFDEDGFRCTPHLELRSSGWREAKGMRFDMKTGVVLQEMQENVVDFQKTKDLLLKTAGGEPPVGGENWLKNLSPGAIFLSRPKVKPGHPNNKQPFCDQFCVIEHKDVTTNLIQKMPTGQNVDLWYPTLEFSRNNDFVEQTGQVTLGYSEEQAKIDSELPEEEGENNDGDNRSGGGSV